MATLNLTTADNYLTLTINGTTIKKLWAKRASDNTTVQVYQKWKDQTSTSYASEDGMSATSQLVAKSSKGYVKGWGNSYVYYSFTVQVDLDDYYENNGASLRTRYYDPSWNLKCDYVMKVSSSEGRKLDTSYGFTTIYRRNDSSYDSKSYTGRLYINRSKHNGSGGTIYDSDETKTANTPSVTDKKKSYTNTNYSGWVGGTCAVGKTITTTTRVKDE